MGFGDPSGNYWLGNDLLSQLTANYRYKLRFDLQSIEHGYWYVAKYSRFRVLPESYNYTLQVTGYSGNASRDGFGQSGEKFSTFDRDNDRWSSGNCAAFIGGGFWYHGCGGCNVNGARSIGRFCWHGVGEMQYSRMWLQCK